MSPGCRIGRENRERRAPALLTAARDGRIVYPHIRISGVQPTMTTPPRLFRALGDPTRLRIVNLLARGSLCVCDIQRILGQPQSSVSRHLALLKSAGLIRDRRDGMRIFYGLAGWDSRLARAVLTAVRAHLAAERGYDADIDDLMRLRERGQCHEEPKARAAGRSVRQRAGHPLEV
jgi:ArsR family transcriptional regulator, arsenate/arsenite/antimonite-responsive transcriptional repressor